MRKREFYRRRGHHRWKEFHRWRKPRRGHRLRGEYRQANVCSYCGEKFTELPYRCNYCGEIFCSYHRLPETHECRGLSLKKWEVYRKERLKREPVEPAQAPPTWVPVPPPIKTKRPSKVWRTVKRIGGIIAGIGGIIVGIICLVIIGFIVWIIWIRPWLAGFGVVPWEQMPPNYYGAAKEYIVANYGAVPHQTRSDLVSLLMRLEPFPEYSVYTFKCSESSALLEWLLEGAGFRAKIAYGATIPQDFDVENPVFHTWIIVEFSDGGLVNIEATCFTKYLYNPPGIVSGWQPMGFFGESVINYDSPSKVFESPEDSMKGMVVMKKSEWDWWNVYPYNSMAPFSEWG